MKTVIVQTEFTCQVDDGVDLNEISMEVDLTRTFPVIEKKVVGRFTGYTTTQVFEDDPGV
jgi:hypothetical protein